MAEKVRGVKGDAICCESSLSIVTLLVNFGQPDWSFGHPAINNTLVYEKVPTNANNSF